MREKMRAMYFTTTVFCINALSLQIFNETLSTLITLLSFILLACRWLFLIHNSHDVPLLWHLLSEHILPITTVALWLLHSEIFWSRLIFDIQGHRQVEKGEGFKSAQSTKNDRIYVCRRVNWKRSGCLSYLVTKVKVVSFLATAAEANTSHSTFREFLVYRQSNHIVRRKGRMSM